eukprot:CAMPEP_0197027810 /NCGR_PEP_ID=MMETSP1384-20130603/7683_1 /TAXON_ID=29189 /ORGANISM="Ammonia sp." /LENGTH=465 /DNA_ID=CAMNT_0042456723 /DNA_START=20 /DNA_END=1417 /DNA_ORIENTATION=+
MGSYCSCDAPDAIQQVEPDTAGKPDRKTKPGKINTKQASYAGDDEELNSSSSDSEPTTSLRDEKSSRSANPSSVDTPNTQSNKEGVITGYKDAIQKGNDSLAMYFVEEWPDLNLLSMKFDQGDNCLHVAVRGRFYNLILYLLTNGVSPNDTNPSTGDTALHVAVRTRDVKVVALLCKYDADPSIENNARESPLSIASEFKDDDIIELLSPETQQMIRSRIGTVFDRKGSDADMRDEPDTPQGADMDDALDDILDEATPPSTDEPQPKLSSFPEPAAVMDTQKLGDGPVALQRVLSDEEKRKLDVLKVQRTNPFTQLKRSNTKQALMEIEKMADAKVKLPALAAWLEKKKASAPYSWQKRWVLVKGSHFLWSDIQRDIKDPKSLAERKKWNNSISLLSVREVKAVSKGKTQRKFTVVVGTSGMKNKRKEYMWKCATKADRDFWVAGLNQHINHFKSVVSYLGTKNE